LGILLIAGVTVVVIKLPLVIESFSELPPVFAVAAVGPDRWRLLAPADDDVCVPVVTVAVLR